MSTRTPCTHQLENSPACVPPAARNRPPRASRGSFAGCSPAARRPRTAGCCPPTAWMCRDRLRHGPRHCVMSGRCGARRLGATGAVVWLSWEGRARPLGRRLLTRRARNASGTATQYTRRNDSPPPPPPPPPPPLPPAEAGRLDLDPRPAHLNCVVVAGAGVNHRGSTQST
jgi:hypothetical protein